MLRGVASYLGTALSCIAYFVAWLLLKVSFVDGVTHWQLVIPGPSTEERLSTPSEAAALPKNVDKDQARFLFDLQEAATAHTDLQVRQLMTLCGAVLTLFVASSGSRPRGPIDTSAAACLLAALALCVLCAQAKEYWSPEPALGADGNPDSARWGLDMFVAMKRNEYCNDTRVEVYRSARRWFLAGVCALSATFLIPGFLPKADVHSAADSKSNSSPRPESTAAIPAEIR